MWTGKSIFVKHDDNVEDWTGYSCVTGYPVVPDQSLSIMEICTATERVTQEAVSRGWTGLPPVTIESGFDLTTSRGVADAWKHLYKHRPDVLVLAWPCNPWCS